MNNLCLESKEEFHFVKPTKQINSAGDMQKWLDSDGYQVCT